MIPRAASAVAHRQTQGGVSTDRRKAAWGTRTWLWLPAGRCPPRQRVRAFREGLLSVSLYTRPLLVCEHHPGVAVFGAKGFGV